MEDNIGVSSRPQENTTSTNYFRRPVNNFRQNHRNNFYSTDQIHPSNFHSSSRGYDEHVAHQSQSFRGYDEHVAHQSQSFRGAHSKEHGTDRNNYGSTFGNRNYGYQNNKSNYNRDQQGPSNFDKRTNHNNKTNNQDDNLNYRKHENRRNYYHGNRRWDNNKWKVREDSVETAGLNQRDSLIWQLTHGKYECMICVSNIRHDAPTWSCDNCYHLFHVACISKWATACETATTSTTTPADGSRLNLRCPACQKQYDLSVDDRKDLLSLYHCFCGKQNKPAVPKRGQLPHSCGDVCGKPSKDMECCRHLCTLLCHPGPCPPCEAVVMRNCNCGKTRLSAKCIADIRTLVCGAVCDKLLNCGVHRCESACHADECSPCAAPVVQRCDCDRGIERTVICGSAEAATSDAQSFSCGDRCDRPLRCGNHSCDSVCHSGDCGDCRWLPDAVQRCWCGKTRLDRQSCVDPVPSCGESCRKTITPCGHECSRLCHNGSCGPCPLARDLPCRCGKSVQQSVKCDSSGPLLCAKVCGKKLQCGRHRCAERCCDSQLHLCWQRCGRTLSCKRHPCERDCGHIGACPPCSNVGFDELHCECGAATALPPIACGQSLPLCNGPCGRRHECEHPVRHNCHSEPACPPCTELTSKQCPGGHRVLDNVPCFRPVATCGLVCGKPLERCDHSCNRICHKGDCLSEGAVCTQPCRRQRVDCGHPCAAPCHWETSGDDCQSALMTASCSFQVVLDCACKTKSVGIACSKLQAAISFSKFNNTDSSKRDYASEFVVSAVDGSVSLACDNECKKVARNLRLADAFDVSITTSNLSTYYSESLKAYAKKNVDFLLYIEKILVDLTRNVRNVVELTHTHTIKNLPEERADFVNRYASCFKIHCKCSGSQAHRISVAIEVNRSTCCLPKPLLSDLLKTEYPDLFPAKIDDDKSTRLPSSTTALTMSFADRIRLSKKE